MRIAQVAPLWELVPPTTYGGTELVVKLLCDELTRLGHEVTLFAARGSNTAATLVECAPMALRAMEDNIKADKTHCTVMSYESMMLQEVYKRAGDFDVIHNHVGFQALPFANFVDTPTVTTLHNALCPEPVHQTFLKNKHLPFISISEYQQHLWPELNYAGTIHHGIDLQRFEPCYDVQAKQDEPYLAFFGRLSPDKGPDTAIQVAKALGMKLVMAGKIDKVDRIYYDKELAHHVDGDQICYIGELNHEQKVQFLRGAAAVLHPVRWPEPFGLVLVESMACGTPVLALKDGSIPEVIDEGKTGAVCTSLEELIEATRNWQNYDRREVRRIAEARFSKERMGADHETLYQQLIDQRNDRKPARKPQLRLTEPVLTPTRIAYARHEALSLTDSVGVPGTISGTTVEDVKSASQSDPDVKEYSAGA